MKRAEWVEEIKVHTVFRKTGKMVCESCLHVKPGHNWFCYYAPNKRKENKR